MPPVLCLFRRHVAVALERQFDHVDVLPGVLGINLVQPRSGSSTRRSAFRLDDSPIVIRART
jgi:hypothetical protein